MIPVVETPEGEVLQDTTAIIDELEQRHPERPVLPQDPVLLLLSRIVEFVVDEFWISTSMHSRWNDPGFERLCDARFRQPDRAQSGTRGAGSAKDRRTGRRKDAVLPSRHRIGEASGQRAAGEYFEAASRALDTAVSPTRYAFGSYPCLVDFCLFTGVLRSSVPGPGNRADLP